jgi:hypothetical protein
MQNTMLSVDSCAASRSGSSPDGNSPDVSSALSLTECVRAVCVQCVAGRYFILLTGR